MDQYVLNGRKIYISGVDEADNVLVVARTEDTRTGKVKPVMDSTFKLEQASAAHARMEAGSHVGKIVLEVN